jgi:hypothetical protein
VKTLRTLFAVLFLTVTGGAFAQDVRVEAVLDTSKMRIGEQVNVDIYVNYDSRLRDLTVAWPSVADTLGHKVEVISSSAIDTTFPKESNSQRIFQHQRITVSVYDSGFFAIPPMRFVLNNDSAKSLYTNPLLLEVHTVPTDTSASKLKDIKPPMEEKFNWRWYLKYVYWALGVLAVIALIVLITLYIARKNRKKVIIPEKPKVPPHITALEALEKIKREQVWKDGHVKEYYSSISDTVRLYIEGRFNSNALESTTDEIMTAFRSIVVDQESKDKLRQLLMLSDLVKFAKMTPIEQEHDLTLMNAFDFVNGTKREEVVPLQPEQSENSNPAV